MRKLQCNEDSKIPSVDLSSISINEPRPCIGGSYSFSVKVGVHTRSSEDLLQVVYRPSSQSRMDGIVASLILVWHFWDVRPLATLMSNE